MTSDVLTVPYIQILFSPPTQTVGSNSLREIILNLDFDIHRLHFSALVNYLHLQTEPIIEDMVLQQTMMQMKHQHLLQQQLMEVSDIYNFLRQDLQFLLRKQAFFFDTKKIFSEFDETLWVSRYMSNEVIFQISASWVIGNIPGGSETDFQKSPL